MRTTLPTLSLCVALSLSGTVAAQETYNLRGPEPKAGQVLSSKMTMVLKDGVVTASAMGMEFAGTLSLDAKAERKITLVAVENGKLTKAETEVIKDVNAQKMSILGMEQENEVVSPLQGKTIVSVRGEKGWTNTLKTGEATDSEKAKLKTFSPEKVHTELYPAEKVAVGHTWKSDAKEWAATIGDDELKDAKGEVNSKFLKVEDFMGESCAVVEMKVKITGGIGADSGVELGLDGTATVHRSLKTGADRKMSFKGTMTMKASPTPGVTSVIKGDVTLTDARELK